MTLVKFLLARIAEDEAAARVAMKPGAYPWIGDTAADETLEMALQEGCDPVGAAHFTRHDPTRVLAECEAKRRIVELHRPDDEPATGGWWTGCEECQRHYECTTLRLLTLPYASHPDYDEAWRP